MELYTCIIIILIIAGKRKHTANIYFIGAYLICCDETSHGCSKIFKEANIRVSIILLARVTIKMILSKDQQDRKRFALVIFLLFSCYCQVVQCVCLLTKRTDNIEQDIVCSVPPAWSQSLDF